MSMSKWNSFLSLKKNSTTLSLESSLLSQNHSDLLSPNHIPEESNGTPLQYSCLENPMDGGAW